MSTADDSVPRNHGPSPPFQVLVNLFERLEAVHGIGATDRRRSLIFAFVASWRLEVGNNLYPAFRLALPQLDSDIRQLYNIKVKTLGKLLVRALGLAQQSPQAQQLLNFKSSRKSSIDNFSQLAFEIIDPRISQTSFSTWTVDALGNQLANLADVKQAEQVEILRKFLQTMNSLEMKWVIRIILRNLHLNVSEKPFFECFHPDAVVLFNVTNNLKQVCYQLWDLDVHLETDDKGIRILQCFKPQRAVFRRHVLEEMSSIIAKMPEVFFIEEKLDGERMQIHISDSGAAIRYFSRRGKDYTELYGSSFLDTKGSISTYLPKILHPSIRSCIFDGEMVAYDKTSEEILSLTKIRQAAQANKEGSWRPLFIAFDIVHLNGKNLSYYALQERKKALEAALPQDRRANGKGIFEILPYKLGRTADDISKEFKRVIAQMSEGLVVKNPQSRYVVDGYNDSWLKVKPEFMAGFQGENFDLIVVGGFYGQGRWARVLASYLCALRSDIPGRYYTLCRVGSGFCAAIYNQISKLTEDKWFAGSPSVKPNWLGMGKENLPDMFIKPEDSLVLEVKASQIIPSDRYYAGYTLRFPRFVALRQDRSFEDCLSLKQFEDFRLDNSSGQTTRKRMQRFLKKPRSKKTKLAVNVAKTPIEPEGWLFENMTFFVCGDIWEPKHATASELEALIVSQGGRISRRKDESTIVVADHAIPRVTSLLARGDTDIVHPRWIYECIEARQLLLKEPQHYFFATTPSLSDAAKRVDKFGFPLTRTPTLERTKHLLDKIHPQPIAESRLNAMLNSLLNLPEGSSTCRPYIFRGALVYFDPSVQDARRLKRIVRYCSGSVTESLDDPGITHMVNDSDAGWSKLPSKPGIKAITSDRIFACWKNGAVFT